MAFLCSFRPTNLRISYGNGSIYQIPMFRGMNIHKSQLFWCEQKGYKGFAPFPYHKTGIGDLAAGSCLGCCHRSRFPHIFVWGSCFWFCTSASPPLRLSAAPTCPHTTCPQTTCPHTTCPHTPCQYASCHTTCPHTVPGVALGDIHRPFAWRSGTWCMISTDTLAWQAWHLVTSIVPLRGGVALGAWYPPTLWRGRRGTYGLRGRRGTWWHPSSLCVAGKALGDIHRHSGVAGVALMGLGWF